MDTPLKVLVVGCGYMGSDHAQAYHEIEGYDIAGLVSRNAPGREDLARQLGTPYPLFDDYKAALASARPDIVSINTYPDTHEAYAIRALEAGCHVFLEKPAATTLHGCRRVIDTAVKSGKKLVVGYILRHHPTWTTFIDRVRSLGKPLVMRMNLNRQSSGHLWERQKRLMHSVSPVVDTGVHYTDIMCRMTGANPIRVSAIGARLSDELVEGMYNYGQLQVTFDDGSVGWYESGWGPMIGGATTRILDVSGPGGTVSMIAPDSGRDHYCLYHHHGKLDQKGGFLNPDDIIEFPEEPGHGTLCKREQIYLLQAIRENLDLTVHLNDVQNSLAMVLAAHRSIQTGKSVELASFDD